MRTRRPERAVAVAEQHVALRGQPHSTPRLVHERRDREVELAVAVEVAHGHGQWGLKPMPMLVGAWKVPLPLPESTLDVVGTVIGRHEVELAVLVEVAHGQGSR